MKRAVIAVGCLVSALIICFTGFFSLSRTCRGLAAPLKEISDAAQRGDGEDAVKKADAFLVLWEEKHGILEALTRHAEVDELEETVKSLPVLARQGRLERLYEESETANNRLEHIISKELPLISNIF